MEPDFRSLIKLKKTEKSLQRRLNNTFQCQEGVIYALKGPLSFSVSTVFVMCTYCSHFPQLSSYVGILYCFLFHHLTDLLVKSYFICISVALFQGLSPLAMICEYLDYPIWCLIGSALISELRSVINLWLTSPNIHTHFVIHADSIVCMQIHASVVVPKTDLQL